MNLQWRSEEAGQTSDVPRNLCGGCESTHVVLGKIVGITTDSTPVVIGKKWALPLWFPKRFLNVMVRWHNITASPPGTAVHQDNCFEQDIINWMRLFIHQSSSAHQEPGHGGNNQSRDAQTFLYPVTFCSSSRGTLMHSQASWEMQSPQRVLGLPGCPSPSGTC